MNIKYINGRIPYILMENIYNKFEIDLIKKELNFLLDENKILYPDQSSSATTNNEILKRNRCIFLDQIYTNKNYSNILRISDKLFDLNGQHLRLLKPHEHWIFKNHCYNNKEQHILLSYYSDGDYYKKHLDFCKLTMLIWLYNEPKKFEGGNLILSDDDYREEILLRNNFGIIFPSMIFHEVTPVKMIDEDLDNDGRICLSFFLN